MDSRITKPTTIFVKYIRGMPDSEEMVSAEVDKLLDLLNNVNMAVMDVIEDLEIEITRLERHIDLAEDEIHTLQTKLDEVD